MAHGEPWIYRKSVPWEAENEINIENQFLDRIDKKFKFDMEKMYIEETETTKLYRVMSLDEFNSLMKNGKFILYDRAMDTKWFATNAEDAAKWAKSFYKDGNYKMVEVTVPTSSLDDMYFAEKLDNIGPAYNAERDLINRVMIGIKEKK